MAEDTRPAQVADAVVRTTTLPLIVTLIVDVVLRTTGVDLGAYQTLVATAVGFVGYAVVRFLEVYVSPKWGYILGLKIASAPTYKGRYAAE